MLLRNNSMATLFARHAQAFQQRLLEHMRSHCLAARSLTSHSCPQETRAHEADVEKMRRWQIVKLPNNTFAPCTHEQARADLNQCKVHASQRIKKTIALADTLREIRLVQGVQLHSQMCLCKVNVDQKVVDRN
jgi:hypothetical protein